MPAINVYLPADLHDRVKAAGLRVSEICQEALEDRLDPDRPYRRMLAAMRELGQTTEGDAPNG